MTPDEITAAQLRIPRHLRVMTPRTRMQYLAAARWWELEALRGYPSAKDSLRYARHMRWAAELALYKPGTWLELVQRVGIKNPGAEYTRGAT